MTRSSSLPSDRDLVGRIARSAGGKAGYKQLVRELGLGGGRERRLLLAQLSRIVAQGELQQIEEGMWARPAPTVVSTSGSDARPPARSSAYNAAKIQQVTRPGGQRDGRERLLSGRIDIHRDGFGFVRPDPSSSSSATGATPANDIFIPPNGLHGAMHGDLVLVEEESATRDGRRSGRVARVLTRRNATLVGIFHYGSHRSPGQRPNRGSGSPSFNFVRPLDERLGEQVEIPEGAELVPKTNNLHRTGFDSHRIERTNNPAVPPENDVKEPQIVQATASSPQASPGYQGEIFDPSETLRSNFSAHQESSMTASLEGLAVEVEITSFAQPGRPARGRLIDVLGPPDAFGVDVEIIIRKHFIPHTFPAHVLTEAEERATETVATLASEEFAEREDFRAFPIVTIDGETARDFDDAVFVRPLRDGNTELQVHIADVSWYVTPASFLDTEARVRGTSVYFPDRAVPMLPHALSSGMCSLLPQQDRLVLSCVMEIDAQGEVVRYRVAEGIIRSVRRMTYTSVQHCLNASPSAGNWNTYARITPTPSAEDQLERERVALEQPELPGAFDRMLDLALQLNRKRVRRGSIDFDLPEPVIEFDPDGNMKAIVRSERGWAHRLIEEFMLSANECVATWLTAQAIPSIYRIHEMPDPKRILDFEETAAAFGQTLGIGALPVKRLAIKSDRREAQRRSAAGRNNRPTQSRDIPERIPVTPQMYQRLVRRIQGKPEERILAYLMLRSLKQARYSEKNEGHFALASPCYTHFTSPIRRYPDLIVHRLTRAMLRSGAIPLGGPLLSTDPQPWKHDHGAKGTAPHSAALGGSQRAGRNDISFQILPSAAGQPRRGRHKHAPGAEGRIGWSDDSVTAAAPTQSQITQPTNTPLEPMPAPELADIAVESSQAERRAADAERELIEWKKIRFMEGRVGDDFSGIILSITKYGFFVELDELFIEGLVPLGSLVGDFYSFRDTDRTICGARNGHCFRMGDRVEVILDRIDRQQHRLQFALKPGTEPQPVPGSASSRKSRTDTKKARAESSRQEKSRSSKARKRRKR